MARFWSTAAALAALCLTLPALPAAGQGAPPAPGAAAPPALPPEPTEPLGLIERVHWKRWLLRVSLGSVGYSAIDGATTLQGRRIMLDEVVVVVPVPERTANSESFADRMTSRFYFDRRRVEVEPVLLDNYYLGARLARWNTSSVRGREFLLTMDLPVQASRLRFDDARARAMPWPEGLYPPIATSALVPELFIERDADEVRALLRHWVGDNPRATAPAVLAKTLAARVIENFTASGIGYEYNSLGHIGGFQVQGAAASARTLRGSPHDMSLLLCALYRASGLPSRIVIGYDIGASGDGLELGSRDDYEDCGLVERDAVPIHPVIRTWVEFYLYDHETGRGEWIPVDVERQRAMSSRARPVDEAWKFFGNMPCGDILIPLAFHFVPPTTVVSPGPPSMWGWLALPATPLIEQRFDVSAFAHPRRPGDDW